MLLFLKLFKKLMVILQSEIAPTQIAWGAALGAMLGFSSFTSLHTYVLVLVILLVNVNVGAALFSAAVFGLLGIFIDPLADGLGYALLVNVPFLQPLWEKLYNMPIVPFTRFYNTVVLGNFVLSLVLLVPVYFLTLRFLKYYRAHLREKVDKWKIMKLLKLTSIYSIYEKTK